MAKGLKLLIIILTDISMVEYSWIVNIVILQTFEVKVHHTHGM